MKCKYKKFLKAAYIDYSEDYCGSGSGVFTKPTVTTPIIVITGTSAIIACAVSGATIYYTLDGSTPTSSSTEYTGAITLTLSCVIKTIAVKPGMSDSAVASESYIHYLTAWKLVGNSEVHGVGNLTSWKVSGNSEVHTLPYPDGIVLPNGYKRCEYLESDGTAYIELPIVLSSSSDSIVIKAAIKTVTDWKGFIAPKTWIPTENKRFVMGSCVSKDNKHLWSPAFGSFGQGNRFFTPELEADTDVHTWSYNNNTFTIDDIYTAKLNSGTFTTDNLRIFYGYNTPFASKICDYHHIKADAEYHLIPCLDSNDTPCMYDVINSQAYYNSAGSGSFTYKLYPQPTEIWSCGDLGQDGKYHVKISNGVTIYDIALTEPLRKVNDVTDTIEFSSGTEGKALVTRYFGSDDMGTLDFRSVNTSVENIYRIATAALKNVIAKVSNSNVKGNIICAIYDTVTANNTYNTNKVGIAVNDGGTLSIYDDNYNQITDVNAFLEHINGVELIYELATPTTELVDAPQIAVSPTDTYTSANVTPYSAFEHIENKEIWSCGEPITESLTLFDGTQELLDGFLSASGAYPTTSSSYPNAKYYVFDVKAGYTITTNITSNIRLRLINNGKIVQNINSDSDNIYVKSTYDPVSATSGYISVRQDCQIGLLVLDSTQSYAGSIVASYIKYHILVQPLGGSIADIALTEPLRKVNDVADTIKFPCETEGKALVTRRILSQNMGSLSWSASATNESGIYRIMTSVNNLYKAATDNNITANILCTNYNAESAGQTYGKVKGCAVSTSQRIFVYDPDYNQSDSVAAFTSHVNGYDVILELTTPTTELVDAPQIAEAESYSMVISQGAKAVEWSSFETE